MNLPLNNAASVLGVGIDIVDIARIRSAHKDHGQRFLDKIFTPEECAYCFNYKHPYPSFAARFAAKEAVSKAFGTGIGKELGFKSIEIIKGARDEPLVRFDAKGQAFLESRGASQVLISLSHTAELATAIALLVK